jgi:hypothetical protein
VRGQTTVLWNGAWSQTLTKSQEHTRHTITCWRLTFWNCTATSVLKSVRSDHRCIVNHTIDAFINLNFVPRARTNSDACKTEEFQTTGTYSWWTVTNALTNSYNHRNLRATPMSCSVDGAPEPRTSDRQFYVNKSYFQLFWNCTATTVLKSAIRSEPHCCLIRLIHTTDARSDQHGDYVRDCVNITVHTTL